MPHILQLHPAPEQEALASLARFGATPLGRSELRLSALLLERRAAWSASVVISAPMARQLAHLCRAVVAAEPGRMTERGQYRPGPGAP